MALKPLISHSVLLAIVLYFIFVNIEVDVSLIVFTVVFCAFEYFYTFYIHFQYYKANKNSLFEIDEKTKIFRYSCESSEALELSFDEVKAVVIYMMPNKCNGRSYRAFPFEDYHYAVICSKKGNITITSLLVGDCMKLFSKLDVKIIKESCLFVGVS